MEIYTIPIAWNLQIRNWNIHGVVLSRSVEVRFVARGHPHRAPAVHDMESSGNAVVPSKTRKPPFARGVKLSMMDRAGIFLSSNESTQDKTTFLRSNMLSGVICQTAILVKSAFEVLFLASSCDLLWFLFSISAGFTLGGQMEQRSKWFKPITFDAQLEHEQYRHERCAQFMQGEAVVDLWINGGTKWIKKMIFD